AAAARPARRRRRPRSARSHWPTHAYQSSGSFPLCPPVAGELALCPGPFPTGGRGERRGGTREGVGADGLEAREVTGTERKPLAEAGALRHAEEAAEAIGRQRLAGERDAGVDAAVEPHELNPVQLDPAARILPVPVGRVNLQHQHAAARPAPRRALALPPRCAHGSLRLRRRGLSARLAANGI